MALKRVLPLFKVVLNGYKCNSFIREAPCEARNGLSYAGGAKKNTSFTGFTSSTHS